jgi:SAM-dependent methyltransferase
MLSLSDTIVLLATVRIDVDEVDGGALASNESALSAYRRDHGPRLYRSFRLLQDHASGSPPLRILELGAAPYFFSALLCHCMPEVELTAANVRAGDWAGGKGRVEQARVRLGIQLGDKRLARDLPIHIFNFERDLFPFSDGAFDVVLCMEVIEHLAYSPTHMLAETHRVLRPGGILILSSPNAVDIIKTARMLRNRPMGSPYSGYGIYGRHNREFTKQELVSLTSACGFQIVRAWAENIGRNQWWPPGRLAATFLLNCTRLPLPYLHNKREYLFVVARATGNPVFAYPEELYSFRELYPRISG